MSLHQGNMSSRLLRFQFNALLEASGAAGAVAGGGGARADGAQSPATHAGKASKRSRAGAAGGGGDGAAASKEDGTRLSLTRGRGKRRKRSTSAAGSKHGNSTRGAGVESSKSAGQRSKGRKLRKNDIVWRMADESVLEGAKAKMKAADHTEENVKFMTAAVQSKAARDVLDKLSMLRRR